MPTRIIIVIIGLLTLSSCSILNTSNRVFKALDGAEDFLNNQLNVDSAEMSLLSLVAINLFLEDELPLNINDLEKIEVKREMEVDIDTSIFKLKDKSSIDYLNGPFLDIVYKPLIDSTLKKWHSHKNVFDSISLITINDSSLVLLYDKRPIKLEAFRISISRKWVFINTDSLDVKLKDTRMVLYDTVTKNSMVVSENEHQTMHLKF
jgi:hypothetical protein